MTAPSGKEGSADPIRGSAAAPKLAARNSSASRRVHVLARRSAFMFIAPLSCDWIGNLKLRLNFQCSPAVGTDAAGEMKGLRHVPTGSSPSQSTPISVVHSRRRESYLRYWRRAGRTGATDGGNGPGP